MTVLKPMLKLALFPLLLLLIQKTIEHIAA